MPDLRENGVCVPRRDGVPESALFDEDSERPWPGTIQEPGQGLELHRKELHPRARNLVSHTTVHPCCPGATPGVRGDTLSRHEKGGSPRTREGARGEPPFSCLDRVSQKAAPLA